MTHICVGKLTIIASDNGLSPERRQAIIWTNAGILLIGPLVTNFSEILIETQTFSLKKIRLKMSSAKWRPFCLCLNELICPCDSIVNVADYLQQRLAPVHLDVNLAFERPTWQTSTFQTWQWVSSKGVDGHLNRCTHTTGNVNPTYLTLINLISFDDCVNVYNKHSLEVPLKQLLYVGWEIYYPFIKQVPSGLKYLLCIHE